MQTIGSAEPKVKLILTLHDLIYYCTRPARVPARTVARGLGDSSTKTTTPAALPAQPRRRGRDGF